MVEMEIVIFDKNSQTVLLKLRHYHKGEDFQDNLSQIISDFKKFIKEKL